MTFYVVPGDATEATLREVFDALNGASLCHGGAGFRFSMERMGETTCVRAELITDEERATT